MVSAGDLVRRYVGPADVPGSLAARARTARWEEFLRRFPDLSSMRVLDLGGWPQEWVARPVRPAQVVTVNLEDLPPVPESEPWLVSLYGDACELPDSIRSERFDLVYSNSVLEHVGGHARRLAFAENVHSAADHHWVQTPYRYFPIEPHWVFPAFQFLPMRTRVAVSRRWPIGPSPHTADPDVAFVDVSWVELLGITEMRAYFPDSTIWRERFAGLTKSIVATR